MKSSALRFGVLLALVVPVASTACGGDSEDGKPATGGTGTGGFSASGGSSGSGGSGGTGGGTGGTGGGTGGAANECDPAPNDLASGTGGSATGGAAGADAGSDASTDPDAAAGGASADASTGGTGGGTGGASSGGTGGGGPTISCGSDTCTGISASGFTLNPCCSVDGCGLQLDATIAGLVGLKAGCYALNQPGSANAACPEFNANTPLGAFTAPGCCRPSGECGFLVEAAGVVDMGCTKQDCGGNGPKTCTP